jgi:hypothetical protein
MRALEISPLPKQTTYVPDQRDVWKTGPEQHPMARVMHRFQLDAPGPMDFKMLTLQHQALHEISRALVRSGFTSLDAQALALGLPRSTAWTVVNCKQKLGRLHLNTTRRILAKSDLPLAVRAAVEAYSASVHPKNTSAPPRMSRTLAR